MIRNRAEPSTNPAAPAGSPGATSAELQDAPPRTDAAPPPSSLVSERSEQPQPSPNESDPRSIPPTTEADGARSIEELEQGESTVAATAEVVTDTAPDGDGRVGELDDAAVAALSVVVAAARSVYEAEGDFGGVSVAVLEGMGLAIPAPSELAQATGEEEVPLTFSMQAAGQTPWEVSVLAPSPGDSGAQAVVGGGSALACGLPGGRAGSGPGILGEYYRDRGLQPLWRWRRPELLSRAPRRWRGAGVLSLGARHTRPHHGR